MVLTGVSAAANDSRSTYRIWIPGDVCQFSCDFGYEVKHKDDKYNQGADHSPCDLPEEVGFVSNHELNIFVKPVKENRSDSGLS